MCGKNIINEAVACGRARRKTAKRELFMWQMEKQQQALPTASFNGDNKRQTASFGMINDDLLLNILSRLPAVSFASAACVNKYWNRICNRVLSRPKLATALSFNPSPEVFDLFIYLFFLFVSREKKRESMSFYSDCLCM